MTDESTTYRLWTPDGTYRGTIDAETPAKALIKRHRRDLEGEPLAPSLDYDPDLDAIIWPDDQTREDLGGVDDWRIEAADESG